MLTQFCAILLAGAIQQAPLPDTPSPSTTAVARAAEASRAKSPRPLPVLVSTVNPDVSEAARKRHMSGNVEISLVVDEKGLPQNVVVTHGAGFGMDEKAIEAVRQYRFKPALASDGTPVPAKTSVTVNFQIF